MSKTHQVFNKPFTPIHNNLFELTHKGNIKNSYETLNEYVEGYELRTDKKNLIIAYSASMENLYGIHELIKGVSFVNILLHDTTGHGFMKIQIDVNYTGPVIKQNYSSNEFFTFHASYKIINCNVAVLKPE